MNFTLAIGLILTKAITFIILSVMALFYYGKFAIARQNGKTQDLIYNGVMFAVFIILVGVIAWGFL